MPTFRKKPVEIEAVQVLQAHLNGDQLDSHAFTDMPGWLVDAIEEGSVAPVAGSKHENVTWEIRTLEGVMTAQVGDYIIQGVQGEIYPCKPGIFAATYEPADADSETEKLRMMIEKISYKLHYEDVFGWDDGDSVWDEMRSVSGH